MPNLPQPAIVFIDDSEEGIFVFKRLLEEAGVENKLLPIRDGAEALKYLGRVATRQVTPGSAELVGDIHHAAWHGRRRKLSRPRGENSRRQTGGKRERH